MKHTESFYGDFKRNFLAGFAALFPIVLTLVLLLWVYTKVERNIGSRVNALCARVLAYNPKLFNRVFAVDFDNLPPEYKSPREYAQAKIPPSFGVVVGMVLVVVAVYAIGKGLRGYIGRRVIGLIDRFFEKFPVIKSVYPHARELTNMFVTERRRKHLGQIVAVPYPRKGIYSLGFKTGEAFSEVQAALGRPTDCIFIPTSPTPFTGFIIFVPHDEVIPLDVPMEEVLRFILTGGVVAPGRGKGKLVHGIYVPEHFEEGGEPVGHTPPTGGHEPAEPRRADAETRTPDDPDPPQTPSPADDEGPGG